MKDERAFARPDTLKKLALEHGVFKYIGGRVRESTGAMAICSVGGFRIAWLLDVCLEEERVRVTSGIFVTFVILTCAGLAPFCLAGGTVHCDVLGVFRFSPSVFAWLRMTRSIGLNLV